jgi:hypothetical protein
LQNYFQYFFFYEAVRAARCTCFTATGMIPQRRLHHTISLKLYPGPIPSYAILSRRWAANPKDEVTFEDITLQPDVAKNKEEYPKIRGCCGRALRGGYHWVWIDTCCIDKKSSTELFEAINSMYNWYEKSEKCYAYLEDVSSLDGSQPLRESSWFTRAGRYRS